jgi:tricorn protease
METVTKGGKSPKQLQLSADGKTIFMIVSGGKIAKLKGGKLEYVSFKAKYTIDFKTERKQIFNEAWRALNANFYDPDFHGKDWAALREKYEPIALSASTYEDFAYIFNVMLGQVNASHMGFYPPHNNNKGETTGLLGVEVVPTERGVKILRVVPGTPADRNESRLYEGEIITAVTGNEIAPDKNFFSFFANTAEEKVILAVLNKDGDEREVVIRPTSSIKDRLYDEWVERERALTEKFSNGKLGYLHIKAMGWDNFETFDRDLAAAGYGKEGLIIDVRYNGGGWITDYLLTVLNYKQHAYTIPRGAAASLKEHAKFRTHYPFGERLPYSAWTKKSIALCNSRSYSNAEIFSHAYKTLGIGTLVGEATFGAVISTGGKGLIDGSYVRLPFRAWYVLKTDENMELGPAVPDVEVENPQNWKTDESDLQLKKAVELLLERK